jgi:Ser/Thr protein kinase RdoA (MazF antagonist)
LSVRPPFPPQDPVLGRFETALDGAAIASLLAPHLAARGLELASCEPDYARLRPRSRLLVRYRLALRDDDAMRDLAGHALLLPHGKAERSWGKVGGPDVFVVHQLGALVWLFPADARLHGLAVAADPDAAAAHLTAALAPGVIDDAGGPWTVEMVRYKPRRRAVLRYRLPGGGALYGKLRSDDRGAAMAAIGQRLLAAGMPTPAPLAYLPNLRLVAYEAAPGTRLKDLRGDPAYALWMEVAAELLARLHALPAEGLPAHSAADEAAELGAAADAVAALVPAVAGEAGRLASELGRRVAATGGRTVAIHGSFHDDQVLVSPAGATMLDLDSAAAGTAAMDVGHFLSYLSADADADGGARAAFLDAYRAADERAPADAPLWEACALLRWSTMPFRELEPDWPAGVAHMVRLAGERMREHRPDGRPAPAPSTTAAAPDWLAPARAALDATPAPIDVFFRDDDAGWDDRRLGLLVDLFAAHGLPLDLAVIPDAITPAVAARLRALVDGGAPLGLHQHGFRHRNHEPDGRPCEFGAARSATAQRRDIAAGRDLLAAALGDAVDPIFTPPWNRCTRATGEALAALGFACLSREARAEPLGVPGLRELQVHVDWFASRRGEALDRAALGTLLGEALRRGGPVGIMFHHAGMDAGERRDAGALLRLLASHERVRPHLMRDLIGAPLPAAAR